MVRKIFTEKQMSAWGHMLADRLRGGDLIAMTGEPGAGKTTLSKAIAAGLGVREQVTSPTFTILHAFDSGRLPLYHFDVYRIDDPDEMFDLGYEDFFYGSGVSIVEWADRIEGLIPKSAIWLDLEYGDAEALRILEIPEAAAKRLGLTGEENP